MNPWIVGGVVLGLILVLAVVADRRGKRHGHINPPENYYDGNPMIHAAREVGTLTSAGGGANGGV
ncbi:hypothetical protein ACFQO7_18910 [Catellatospora aurea]|uniref:Secreted protein with PEP-CTERM sorting signal n=1 Tax=Catellatospora aurea TaxID=1337874 RepID=A0ABW2GXA1_9ACTN